MDAIVQLLLRECADSSMEVRESNCVSIHFIHSLTVFSILRISKPSSPLRNCAGRTRNTFQGMCEK